MAKLNTPPPPPGFEVKPKPKPKLTSSAPVPPMTGSPVVELETIDAPGFTAGKPIIGGGDYFGKNANALSPRTEGALFPNPDKELDFYKSKYGNQYNFMKGGPTQGLLYKPLGDVKGWREVDPFSPFAGQDLTTSEGWKGAGREVFQDIAEAIPGTVEGIAQNTGATLGSAAQYAQTVGTAGTLGIPAVTYPYIGAGLAAGATNVGKQALRESMLGSSPDIKDKKGTVTESGKTYGGDGINPTETAIESGFGLGGQVISDKIVTPALKAFMSGSKNIYHKVGNALTPKTKLKAPTIKPISELDPKVRDYWTKTLEELLKSKDESTVGRIPQVVEFLSQLKGIKDPLILERYLNNELGVDIEGEVGKKIISGVTNKLYPDMNYTSVQPFTDWASQEVPPSVRIPRFQNIQKATDYIKSAIDKLGGKKSPQLQQELRTHIISSKDEFDPIFEKGYNYVEKQLKGITVSPDGLENLHTTGVAELVKLSDEAISEAKNAGLLNNDGYFGNIYDLSSLLDVKRKLSKFSSINPDVKREISNLNKYVRSLLKSELDAIDKTNTKFNIKEFLNSNSDLKGLTPHLQINSTTKDHNLGDLFAGLESQYGDYTSTLNQAARKIKTGVSMEGTTTNRVFAGKNPLIETSEKIIANTKTGEDTILSPAIRKTNQINANRMMDEMFSKVTNINNGKVNLDTGKFSKMVNTPEYAQLLQYLKNAGDSENYYKLNNLRDMFSDPNTWKLNKDIITSPVTQSDWMSNPVKTAVKTTLLPAYHFGVGVAHTAASQLLNKNLRKQLGNVIVTKGVESQTTPLSKRLYNKLMEKPKEKK